MPWRQDRMIAVKVGVGPTIMLRSGAWFDFCAPASSSFTIEDIAHGLANICGIRANAAASTLCRTQHPR